MEIDHTYHVMPFGSGNFTGYRVVIGDGSDVRIAARFVDDSAKERADELAATLNLFLRPICF